MTTTGLSPHTTARTTTTGPSYVGELGAAQLFRHPRTGDDRLLLRRPGGPVVGSGPRP